MKLKLMTAIALTAMAMISCNEDTGVIGTTLTNETDKLNISTGFFTASSRSIKADSVYARNFDCYLGLVRDPETGSYVMSEFMAQFTMLESFTLPDKSDIISKENDEVIADSCDIWLVFNRSKCYGDSLTPLKINVMELGKAMSDTKTYYSNYDPIEEGYIRTDGLKKPYSFTIANLNYTDSARFSSKWTDFTRIPLNDPYTAKNGKTYKNYGTYIMQTYYEHPEYFKTPYNFTQNVCPGFYFEVYDGLGVMTNVAEIDMQVYYRFKKDTTTYVTSIFTASTPEVLQTARVFNDESALQRLIDDKSCTYLKAPAGVFTEVTLPVDEITTAHAKDSLLSVSIDFFRENSLDNDDPFPISAPSNVLMVQKEKLYTFFETSTMYDNQSSFMSTLSKNTYRFDNIGNLITLMAKAKKDGLKSDPNWVMNHPDWNKVVLVPIAINYTTSTDAYGNISNSVAGLGHQLGLSSTKLVGGENHPIEIEVIFAKFNEK